MQSKIALYSSLNIVILCVHYVLIFFSNSSSNQNAGNIFLFWDDCLGSCTQLLLASIFFSWLIISKYTNKMLKKKWKNLNQSSKENILCFSSPVWHELHFLVSFISWIVNNLIVQSPLQYWLTYATSQR